MKRAQVIRREMCATCPWREGSPYAYLEQTLTESAMTEASRICHNTGKNNAINKRTGKPEMLCRGARNVQLRMFAAMGVIKAPNDESWVETCRQKGLPEPVLEG